MLVHQRNDVRVSHQVAADRVIADKVLIHPPEPVGLAGAAHVSTTDKLVQVLPRLGWIKRLIENTWVRGDP